MIGVLPIGRQVEGADPQAAFFWSLKTSAFADWRSRGLDPWKEEVLRHWPEVAPLIGHIADPDQMVLASYHHHTLTLPFGDRLASSATAPMPRARNWGRAPTWRCSMSRRGGRNSLEKTDLQDALMVTPGSAGSM